MDGGADVSTLCSTRNCCEAAAQHQSTNLRFVLSKFIPVTGSPTTTREPTAREGSQSEFAAPVSHQRRTPCIVPKLNTPYRCIFLAAQYGIATVTFLCRKRQRRLHGTAGVVEVIGATFEDITAKVLQKRHKTKMPLFRNKPSKKLCNFVFFLAKTTMLTLRERERESGKCHWEPSNTEKHGATLEKDRCTRRPTKKSATEARTDRSHVTCLNP